MRLLELKFGVALATLLLAGVAVAAAPEGPNKEDPNYQFGELAGNLMQAGHFLEIVTNRECKKFSRSLHSAASDLKEIALNVPSTMLPPNVRFEDAIREVNVTRRGYAEREIGELKNKLTANGTAPELECGILLGIASVAYYQARAILADYHKLERPVWQQP